VLALTWSVDVHIHYTVPRRCVEAWTYTVSMPRTRVMGRWHSWARFRRTHGLHGIFLSHLIFLRLHSTHDRDTRCDDLMLCSSIVEVERCKARRSCKQTEADGDKTRVGHRAVDQRPKNRPTGAAACHRAWFGARSYSLGNPLRCLTCRLLDMLLSLGQAKWRPSSAPFRFGSAASTQCFRYSEKWSVVYRENERSCMEGSILLLTVSQTM
jgi:hypothetical protein